MKRGLPVTPGTLYLAHFAGAAGAIAILSALEEADAASIMAGADATGRTKREKLVKANPFLERFTVADLKSWADRKMRIRRSLPRSQVGDMDPCSEIYADKGLGFVTVADPTLSCPHGRCGTMSRKGSVS
jgi:hypothetical protein